MISSLLVQLRNQQVQQACLTALHEDPAFHDMLARLPEAVRTLISLVSQHIGLSSMPASAVPTLESRSHIALSSRVKEGIAVLEICILDCVYLCLLQSQQGALPGRSMELANLLPLSAQTAEVSLHQLHAFANM